MPLTEGQTVSALDLAGRFELAPPFKLSSLIRRLDPVGFFWSSGDFGPSTTTGWAQIIMNSAGFYTYRGHVHESGLIGHHYTFAAALDFRDERGQPIVFVAQGEVDGTADPFGSRDSDWAQHGHNRLIADRWDEIRGVRAEFDLRVTTDPIEAIPVITGLAIVIAAGATVFHLFANDPKTHCETRLVPGSGQPDGRDFGVGVGHRCERE